MNKLGIDSMIGSDWALKCTQWDNDLLELYYENLKQPAAAK